MQRDTAENIAPGIGIFTEIALLQLRHQPTQILMAQIGTLTEHPVIPGNGVNQPWTLRLKVLQIPFGIETRYGGGDTSEYIALGQAQGFQIAGLFAQYPIHHVGQ